MAGRGRERWEGSGVPPDGQVEVRRPSQRAEMGQEALSEVQEGLGGRSERGGKNWEALLEGREGSGGPSKDPGVVRRAGRGWKSNQEGREGL